MTTTVYDTKRALFDTLAAYTGTGQPLAGVQVSYAWPGTSVDLECIYGGGVRFDQIDAIAEHPGVLVQEIASLSLYIRVVQRPTGPVSDADARAAEIGAAVGAILRANPALAGGGTSLGIASGQGDYSQTPDETTAILSYQVRVARNITYGGA